MLDGTEGWVRQFRINAVEDPSALVPIGSTLIDLAYEGGREILAAHGGLAYHERPDGGGARFCLQLCRAPMPMACEHTPARSS